ncbi:MAG: phosphoribosylformylglycinamidine synthase subunit PurS [Acidobacteria bacterium]|nr:phosphoribosylformylglycinamidine synthase subunit PurS [Acidobacteriota bacterium]
MPRTALYLKVEVEHDPHETPEQLAEEMCRRLLRLHGVRAAELSAFVAPPQPETPPSSSL